MKSINLQVLSRVNILVCPYKDQRYKSFEPFIGEFTLRVDHSDETYLKSIDSISPLLRKLWISKGLSANSFIEGCCLVLPLEYHILCILHFLSSITSILSERGLASKETLGITILQELDNMNLPVSTKESLSKSIDRWTKSISGANDLSELPEKCAPRQLFLELENFVYEGLLSLWDSRGYLSKMEHGRGLPFGRRISHLARNYDLGSPVYPHLFRHEDTAVIQAKMEKGNVDSDNNPTHWFQAPIPSLPDKNLPKNFSEWGFCVLRGILSTDELDQLRKDFLGNEVSASEIGMRITLDDGNVSHGRFSEGRLHLLLRGTRFESFTTPLHGKWMAFIHQISENNRKLDATHISDDVGNLELASKPVTPSPLSTIQRKQSNLYLADVRLLVVDHAPREEKRYYCDDVNEGFTLYVPLADVHPDMPSFRLAAASHNITKHFGNSSGSILICSIGKFCNRFLSGAFFTVNDTYEDNVWRAGDALILDSRTLYKMSGGEAFKCTPFLIFRFLYDSSGSELRQSGGSRGGLSPLSRRLLFNGMTALSWVSANAYVPVMQWKSELFTMK